MTFANRKSHTPKPTNYAFKAIDYTRQSEGKVMWQYWVDDGVDGKRTGWYDYTEDASKGVDEVFIQWQDNDWLNVRCIASGNYSYKVDFNQMQQQNISTSKTRSIRRTVNGRGP